VSLKEWARIVRVSKLNKTKNLDSLREQARTVRISILNKANHLESLRNRPGQLVSKLIRRNYWSL